MCYPSALTIRDSSAQSPAQPPCALGFAQPLLPPEATNLEKIGLWIYEHPTTVKVAEYAGIALGIGLVATLPFSAPVLGLAAVAVGACGLLIAGISATAYYVLDLAVPPHHDMSNHVFTPGECKGGKLYYQGDIPILSLDADHPHLAGKAQGYLLGDTINRIFKRLNTVQSLEERIANLFSTPRHARASEVPLTLQQIKETLPREYLEEMQGLVEGFAQWAKENPLSFPSPITLDEVLLVHLMPDMAHFSPASAERWTQRFGQRAVACSAIIDRDREGMAFARNMDWPSFGLMGTYSLIINRKHKDNGYNTVEVGIPGFVGTLTGMNDRGLSLAMNVCSGQTPEVRGMPAAFYNRRCLETCSNVGDVESYVDDHNPLGPYHLTAADAWDATSFHFYQTPSQEEHVRRNWSEGDPLVVLNWRYPNAGSSNAPMYASEERERVLRTHFANRQNDTPSAELVSQGLSLPYINNWVTTHSVLMKPRSRSMEVSFDNGFAARNPRHTLSTQELFA